MVIFAAWPRPSYFGLGSDIAIDGGGDDGQSAGCRAEWYICAVLMRVGVDPAVASVFLSPQLLMLLGFSFFWGWRRI